MKRIWGFLFCVAISAAAQSTNMVTTPGGSATIFAGTGTPASNSLPCNSTVASPTATYLYNQTDITVGNSVWKCTYNPSSTTYSWVAPFSSPVLQVGTTGTITGGAFILGGCTSVTTLTMTGATVGTNAAFASPIYATAPSGAIGLFTLNAWVSAANTVSVQGCAAGVLGAVPNFTARVILY